MHCGAMAKKVGRFEHRRKFPWGALPNHRWRDRQVLAQRAIGTRTQAGPTQLVVQERAFLPWRRGPRLVARSLQGMLKVTRSAQQPEGVRMVGKSERSGR